MGARVDWLHDRYQSLLRFVRAMTNRQFLALDKVKFGLRYTIYSPLARQPSVDHNGAEGGRGGPTECT
jgi:leucyl-tRNA synthetase